MMKDMMQDCMTKCRGYQWVILGIGVVLLILGVFLSAAMVKALWVILSLVIIVWGGYCAYMYSQEKAKKEPPKKEDEPQKPEEPPK